MDRQSLQTCDLPEESIMNRPTQVRNALVLLAFLVLPTLACLPVPGAWCASYYVSTAGDDTNPGTSPELAWRTISHAAEMARAGDLVRIKGGDYGHENVVVANSGTEEAPIRFEGYDGDAKLEGVMKEENGRVRLEGHGVEIKDKSHIKLSGITTLKYRDGITVAQCHHVTVERCTAGVSGWAGIALWGSHDCEIRYCTAYDADMCNFWVGGCDGVTVADCWSYSDPLAPAGTKTDYCYGMASSKNVHITRCRGDGRLHAGHGSIRFRQPRT